MTNRPGLPEPGTDAMAASLALRDLILQEIGAGGWLPFSRFMELALYAPGLGYYSGGAAKLGEAGDFTTAPQMTPVFARLVARQAAQALKAMPGGVVVEIGAGSGRLARDLLPALDALDCLPQEYLILEVSADLRARQQHLIASLPAHLAGRMRWLDTLPDRITGVIIGNEVLDAMPVELVVWRPDGLFQRGVAAQDAQFHWADRPVPAGALLDAAQQIAAILPEPLPAAGYLSEINLAAGAFMRTLGARLVRGLALFIDYGFGAAEYYHPQRSSGTLMCHYRHHAHADPFHLPGLTDITAHVDFSSVHQAADAAGLQLAGYTTQAHFLINCGLDAVLGDMEPGSPAWLREVAMVQKLVSPAEMGELFKAIAFTRGFDEPLVGFRNGDRSRML